MSSLVPTVHTYPGDGFPHNLEGTDCPCGVQVWTDGATIAQVVHRWIETPADLPE